MRAQECSIAAAAQISWILIDFRALEGEKKILARTKGRVFIMGYGNLCVCNTTYVEMILRRIKIRADNSIAIER